MQDQEWETTEVFSNVSVSALPLTPGSELQLTPQRKTIHIIRHGQAIHNVKREKVGHGCSCPAQTCPYVDSSLLDPPLTNLGKTQARAVNKYLSENNIHIDCAMVSPLYRTVQTLAIVLEGEHLEHIPIFCKEELREQHGVHHCDKRGNLQRLKQEYPRIDYSEVTEEDGLWREEKREEREEMEERSRRMLEHLKLSSHRHFLIVSHASFLHVFFSIALNLKHHANFENGELKSFVLTFH